MDNLPSAIETVPREAVPRLERQYRLKDENATTITHGVGLLLAVAGLSVLVILAPVYGSVWQIVGCCAYGMSLVILYGASTIYQWPRSPRAKAAPHAADHAYIFLLIAATDTPFKLTSLIFRTTFT